MLRTRPLLALLLQLLSIPGVKSDCYNLNGELALNTTVYNDKTEMVSCGKGTNNCCLRNEQCGSNLLCKSADGPDGGYLKRQYCDNVFWNGCSKIAPGTKNGGIVLDNCGNNVVTWGSGNCTAGPFFFVDPLDGSTTSMSTSSGSTATASYWSVDTAAALASQSAASVSASLASLTTSLSEQPTSASASTTPTSSTPSQTPIPSAGSSGLSAGAGAGIGIGAAAGIAGIAVLGWLWMRERKKRRALQYSAQQPYAPATSEAAYSTYPQNDTYKVTYAQHHESEVLYPPQELDSDRPRNEAP